MNFTAIHRALGEQPGPLTWDMVDRAVSQRLVETADLDWKRDGYAAEKKWDELAKDVAAFANSGGGILVLGVQESSAAASSFSTPQTLADADERNHRAAIFGNTHPPVQGVTFQNLNSVDGSKSIVVVHVPASPDAPHLVYKDRQNMFFAAPFRDGTRTEFMRERQLEAAYRQRFAGRSGRDTDLQSLYDETAAIFDPANRACIVAVARPEQPRPAAYGRIAIEQVRAIFQQALAISGSFVKSGSLATLTDAALGSPRLGLRRHVAYGSSDDARAVSVALLDDGSLALAWAIGGGHPTIASSTIPDFAVERTAIDLASLIGATTRGLGMTSAYAVQMGLEAQTDDPITVNYIPNDGFGRDTSAPVRVFRPASSSTPTQPTDNDLVAVARDLALDCLAQAGVGWLRLIREPLSQEAPG